jgi:predicted RNA polymerase sigma factor
VKHNREKEALELLEARAPTLEQYPDLQLARAAILGVANRDKESQAALRMIQARWPEWDLPYLVHGLLLERAGRGGEALPKLRTAIALGSQDPAAHCALARLSSSSATDSSCACLADFRQWLLRSCDSK